MNQFFKMHSSFKVLNIFLSPLLRFLRTQWVADVFLSYNFHKVHFKECITHNLFTVFNQPQIYQPKYLLTKLWSTVITFLRHKKHSKSCNISFKNISVQKTTVLSKFATWLRFLDMLQKRSFFKSFIKNCFDFNDISPTHAAHFITFSLDASSDKIFRLKNTRR